MVGSLKGRSSLLRGASRFTASVADFNEQLASWLPTANRRTIHSLHARPIDRVTQDRTAMPEVPPPPPPPIGFNTRIRLARDYYVRVFGNDAWRSLGRKSLLA
jgi:hypothetical protein